VASNGYVLIYVGHAHPLADVRGYAYEHRLVAMKKIGRLLTSEDIIHHIDHDKQNNIPSNVEIVTPAEHRHRHRIHKRGLREPDEANPSISCACGCGARLRKYDGSNRPRRYISGHNEPSSPTVDAILGNLDIRPMTRMELIEQTGISKRAVAACLSKLKSRGRVFNHPHGVWQRTPGVP